MEERDDYPIIPQPEENKTFTVRIIKVSSKSSWYKDKVGQEFEVYVNPDLDKTVLILEQDRLARFTQRFISSFDCEPVDKLNKYQQMEKELASLKEDFIRIREQRDEYWEKYKELQKAVGDALLTEGGVMHPAVYNHLIKLIQKP